MTLNHKFRNSQFWNIQDNFVKTLTYIYVCTFNFSNCTNVTQIYFINVYENIYNGTCVYILF